MLKNYFLIAFRRLRGNRAFATINFFGLSVGMACCLLALLYVQREFSYDRFHTEHDRIHRLVVHYEGDVIASGANPMGPALTADYAAIENYVRFYRYPGLVRSDGESFRERAFFFADSSLFDVFNFRLLRGNPAEALNGPLEVVLTASSAEKYFPGQDPIGQTITFQETHRFEVTGVMEDVPTTSHITFDFVASYASLDALLGGGLQSWFWNPFYTYLLLSEEADPAVLEAQFPAFVKRHMGDEASVPLHLQPLTEIHLYPASVNELQEGGSAAYVLIAISIALCIFLIASINYMNLTTARFAQRSKEIGMRKVAGATRGELVRQFLGEALLFGLAALAVALVLIHSALYPLNTLLGLDLEIDYLNNPVLVFGALALALTVGLVSGSYPALFLSGLPPLKALRDPFRLGGTSAPARKVLVVFQFVVSAGLIICTAIILSQFNYVNTKDLGLDAERLLVIPLEDRQARQQVDVLRKRIEAQPGVVSITAASDLPGREERLISKIGLPGSGQEEDVKTIGVLTVAIDEQFVGTLGITVAEGRDLSEAMAIDASENFIVNEAAARLFESDAGWDSALDEQLEWYYSSGGYVLDKAKKGRIVGVLEDFNFESLQREIEPIILHVWPSLYSYLAVRLAPAEAMPTLERVRGVWQEVLPGLPFEYSFMAEDLDALYQDQQQAGNFFVLLAFVAIFIACLGLLGLSAYMVERRMKEIGVRKVLGASTQNVLVLMTKDFAVLVLLAIVIAVPLAYVAGARWLENFAYRVEISPLLIVVACLATLVIALATVITQALRAALSDPVEVLRYE